MGIRGGGQILGYFCRYKDVSRQCDNKATVLDILAFKEKADRLHMELCFQLTDPGKQQSRRGGFTQQNFL